MARKDVDLVIRAKDEAAKVVDSITKALNEFNSAQSELAGKSTKTQTALGGLGASVSALDKALKSLDGMAAVTGEMDKAAAAMSRLDTEAKDLKAEAQALSKELNETGFSAERLSSKAAGARAALDKQAAAAAKARKAQSELKTQLEETQTALAKQEKTLAALPAKIDKQAKAFADSSARVEKLKAEIASAEKPSKTLANQLEAAGRAAATKAAQLTKLQAELAQTSDKAEKSRQAIAGFTARLEAQAGATARQEAVLAKVSANYDQLRVKAAAAEKQLAKTSVSFDKTATRADRAAAAASRAQQVYGELTAAAKSFDAALSESTGGAKSGLEEQLVAQGIAAQKAQAEVKAMETTLAAYQARVGALGVPTREMSREMAIWAQRIEEGRMSVLLQQETLEKLGAAYREAGSDLSSITAAQAKFVEAQGRLGAAMQETANDGFRQRQAIRELHAETEKVARSTQQATRETAASGQAAASAASSWGRLSEAYRRLYGDSRQAMSFTQRLRGEVLSLISAYGGLFGVITAIQGVIEATQQLEAAQARLNVVNDGNLKASAQDMDFLQRNAARLGVDIGTLSTEYSKFALATKGTNLEGEKTKDIFISVAEAARVNRTSTAEMSGVFVALAQIASKGAVQMEELRQQLGDRLPGALQLMADGLNVTTAELIKMMEQGQVSSEALVPFAKELDERFGPGLAEALQGTSVAIGRLQNAATQAMVRFGKGGFMDAFEVLLNDLTDLLGSANFLSFLDNLSAGMAVLVDAVSFAAQNFQLLITALTAILALKVAPFFVGLVEGLRKTTAESKAATAQQKALGATVAATGGQAAKGAVGIRAAAGAIKGLLASTGIGLLALGIGTAIGYWVTEADAATEALTRHNEVMQLVKNAYDEAGGKVEDWRKKLDGLTLTELKRNLREVSDVLADQANELAINAIAAASLSRADTGPGLGVDPAYAREIQNIVKSYRAGVIGAKAMAEEIEKTNRKFDDGTNGHAKYAETITDLVKPMIEVEKAQTEAQLAITAMTGSAEEADVALKTMNDRGEATSDVFGNKATTALNDFKLKMDELKEAMPQIKSEMSEFEATVSKIETAFAAALASARAMPDAIMRIAAEQEALRVANDGLIAASQNFVDAEFGSATDGVTAAAAMLRKFEGFRATPYWDKNALRIGYGSDKITLSDQSTRDVVEGMTVSVADANRDLLRRITQEFMPKARAAAGARFDSFTPQQQAALTSIAYNYGSIPGRIQGAVATGSMEDIANAIRGLAGDNNGQNRKRRYIEAAMFTSDAAVETQALEQERQAKEQAKEAEDAAQKAAEAQQRTQERLADGQFEIDQQALINAGKERQAAIEDAIRAAKAENPAITQAEIDKIAEQTGKLFDMEMAQKNVTTAKERAEEAEQKVNDLMTQRAALMDQMEMAQKNGDTELQEQLRGKVAEVNAELVAAIQNSKALWEAVGGTEAGAAIEKLNAATMEAKNFEISAKQNYLEWNKVGDLFVTGLSSAFDSFSQSVAEGQSVGEAARNAFLQFASDFLKQIAQMIIQQAILNALRSAFGGTSFGSMIGLAHTGGIIGSQRAGSGNGSRRVDPGVFAAAPRYHNGGIVGLAPNEVPMIAEKGEAMLTEDDPFHPKNRSKLGLGGKATTVKNKIVNAIDGASFLAAALASEEGESVLLNFMRANADAVTSTRG